VRVGRPTSFGPCRAAAARAFTMIEIMLVIGILGLVLGLSAPSFYQAVKTGAMRQAVSGLTEACETAKARAILGGHTVKLTFQPRDRTFSVEGGPMPGVRPGAKGGGTMDDSLVVEMLDVNLIEHRDADVAEVRFFPEGTCDELTVILHSDQNNWVKLSLNPVTSILKVGKVE
jgi:prepilin-type N-terminal cleavage/methylation domain-containing protein